LFQSPLQILRDLEELVRRLKIGALVSLDGVQGEPRSWASAYFDDAAAAASLARLNVAGAMLMGRRTYEYFAPAWPLATGPYAERVNGIRKYVFSASLASVDWSNAELVAGDAVAAVRELKQGGDGDLVVYGFGRLSHALLAAGLVDELALWVHPVVLGHGESVFHTGPTTALTLSDVERAKNGVVSLRYTRE
jgi:dihydrofolate reductase